LKTYDERGETLKDCTKFAADLMAKDDEPKQLRPKYKETRIQLDKAIIDNTGLLSAPEDAQRGLAEIRDEQDETDRDLGIIRGQTIPRLEDTLQRSKDEAKEAKTTLGKRTRQCEELAVQRSRLQATKESLSSDLEALKAVRNQCEQELTALRDQCIPRLETSLNRK